jgi:hypothetical protein
MKFAQVLAEVADEGLAWRLGAIAEAERCNLLLIRSEGSDCGSLDYLVNVTKWITLPFLPVNETRDHLPMGSAHLLLKWRWNKGGC